MTSFTALKHGQKCMQELDRFSYSMGWTTRTLDEEGSVELDCPRDNADLLHTAFGNAVEIPKDFVPPQVAASRTKKRPTSTNKLSRFYRSGPTSCTSAKTRPNSRHPTQEQHFPMQHKNRAHKSMNKPAESKKEPMDFVYSIDVRRKLREQLDAERKCLLQATKAREAQLRADNKWVFDKRDKMPQRRKQAWQISSKPDKSSSNLVSSTKDSTKSSKGSSSSKPCLRAASAPSKCPSLSYTSTSSTCDSHAMNNSLRHRVRRHPTNDADEVEHSIREFEQRLQTQWTHLHIE